MPTWIQRQTCSSTTCWKAFKQKKEVLQLGLHLQSLPFSIPGNKKYVKTPQFGSSMPWHKNNHLWPKVTMVGLSTQGAVARELICCKVTHCSRGITFFKFNWSFDGLEQSLHTPDCVQGREKVCVPIWTALQFPVNKKISLLPILWKSVQTPAHSLKTLWLFKRKRTDSSGELLPPRNRHPVQTNKQTIQKSKESSHGWEVARNSLGNWVQSANSEFIHVNCVHSNSVTNML